MRNFRAHQDRAKAVSRRLLVLFAFSVMCLVLLTSGILAVLFEILMEDSAQVTYGRTSPPLTQRAWQLASTPEFILGCGLFVLIGMGLFSAIRRFQMRAGGQWVARQMGGQEVTEALFARRAPSDLVMLQRFRAMSVLKEMSLAANIPTPRLFIIPDDTINAFAAGYTVEDAVVGLTQGSIDQLTRSELQGVIAHELSHIIHGDMRLNMRIITLLAGLTFIHLLGEILARSANGNNKNAGPLVLAGLALMLLGMIGVFFGNMIQAAISRQREFLADATAVQYTRNPRGIAQALAKIGQIGSAIEAPASHEFRHMMFGQSDGTGRMSLRSAFSRLFDTHPPIEKRLARLGALKKSSD